MFLEYLGHHKVLDFYLIFFLIYVGTLYQKVGQLFTTMSLVKVITWQQPLYSACVYSRTHFEGSRPERCISSMMYSRDTPFWSKTLEFCTASFGIICLLLERVVCSFFVLLLPPPSPSVTLCPTPTTQVVLPMVYCRLLHGSLLY